MVASTSRTDLVNQMKVTDPEMFHSMVKMHLSFLLDLHTDECDCSFVTEKQDKQNKMKKAFTPMKKKSVKGVMDGMPLTTEGVCQVYQIIEYLGRKHNITCEGIFRKHGNLKKQQALKERLNKSVALNLDEDEFSVHECAGVLKNFLAALPEPLLTDAYYRAHCQVPGLCKDTMTEKEKEAGQEKRIAALQLLFQLIPEVNYSLLKELLILLNKVSQHHEQNKMNARNLGTIFSTHIICPKKMSPEELQSKHQLLADAAAFMIENADKVFDLPDRLLVDIDVHLQKKRNNMFLTPKPQARKPGVSLGVCKEGSPIVNTVFSFVDREASKSQSNATDEALAALYAHVQSMPESAQKRRLVEKLNSANGTGTPDVATSGSVRTVGRRQRRKTGDGFINMLTPRRKRTTHGSYNLRQASSHLAATNMSLQVPASETQPTSTIHKTPRTRSSPALLSPRARLPTPPHFLQPGSPLCPVPSTDCLSPNFPVSTPISQTSDVVAVDEVDTPGQDSTRNSDEQSSDSSSDNLVYDEVCVMSTGEHDGSFIAPPLPPRTPAPILPPSRTPAASADITTAGPSPLSNMSQKLSGRMLEAAMTPRSRLPVMVCSVSQLEKWNNIVDHSSPALKEKPSNDEELQNDDSDAYTKRKDSCRTRSLSSDFKHYLATQGIEVAASDTSSLEDSTFSETDEKDASYSTDVRRLLKQGDIMSPSMQAIMDGASPSAYSRKNDDFARPPCRKSPRLSSTSSMGSESSRSTIKADNCSQQDLGDSFDENQDPNCTPGVISGVKSRKRRSLTEIGSVSTINITSAAKSNNIFFETDL